MKPNAVKRSKTAKPLHLGARLVALALVPWLATGCGPAKGAATPAAIVPVPVRTAPVTWARRAPAITATGALAGKEEVKLSFKIGGLVERIFFEEGATVRAGQLLARLKQLEIGAAVGQTRSALAKAERDLARAQDLFAGKAATLEQVENASTAVDVARAALDGTSFNEEHASIHAPASGKIMRRLAEAGELVAPGAPVLLLRASGRGWVLRVGVSDRDVMRVALGDPASLRFGALPGRDFAATVSEIAESASATTGTYELELSVEAAGAPLRSGLLAQAVIRPSATERYGFIPIEALQEGSGGDASVFVASADGRRAVRRKVSVAYLDGEEVAIAHGLEGVSAVVRAGAEQLTPDAPIEVAAREVTP